MKELITILNQVEGRAFLLAAQYNKTPLTIALCQANALLAHSLRKPWSPTAICREEAERMNRAEYIYFLRNRFSSANRSPISIVDFVSSRAEWGRDDVISIFKYFRVVQNRHHKRPAKTIESSKLVPSLDIDSSFVDDDVVVAFSIFNSISIVFVSCSLYHHSAHWAH